MTHHPMECLIERLTYHGIPVEVVMWSPTVFCGFSTTAPDSHSGPEVEQVTEKYRHLLPGPLRSLPAEQAGRVNRSRPQGFSWILLCEKR